MAKTEPIVSGRGAGDRRWFFGGGVHEWKATSASTGGSLLVFEDGLEAGKVTPLHAHPRADEFGYVLEGEIELYLAGDLHHLNMGSFFFTPRGTPHAFRTLTKTILLSGQTPGDGDAFYMNASEPLTSGTAGRVDFEAVGKAAQDTGTTLMLGPPPFQPVDKA